MNIKEPPTISLRYAVIRVVRNSTNEVSTVGASVGSPDRQALAESCMVYAYGTAGVSVLHCLNCPRYMKAENLFHV